MYLYIHYVLVLARMHKCTHACMHACMHTCIHDFWYIFKHVCIHTCMPTYMHACIHTYIRTYMHACMHDLMHPEGLCRSPLGKASPVTSLAACAVLSKRNLRGLCRSLGSAYIYSYIHVRMIAYIHTDTHMHACIYTCIHACTHTLIHTIGVNVN